MLTLEDLTTGAPPLLRPIDAAPSTASSKDGGHDTPDAVLHIPATQAIEQVQACDARWRLPDSVRRVPGRLAVVPPPSPETAAHLRLSLRTLASQGTLAVAVADPAPRPRPAWALPEVLAAARSAGLPLLVSAGSATVSQLQALILQRQVEALAAARRQIGALLSETRRLDQKGEGPGPLLRWLADQTASTVTIVTHHGSEAWATLAEHSQVLEQLAAGRMDSAAVQTDGRHIRLHALGATVPHPVLAAVRDAPWPRHLAELISQAAGQVALLQQPAALRAQEQRLQASTAAVKVAVLQHLMAGDVIQAARLAAPLRLDLLAAHTAEVCVVGCAPGEERTAVAAACEGALAGQALVVMCPAEHTHVIIIHPHTENRPTARQLLKPVISAHPERAMGVSQPTPWTEIEAAYTAASHALIKAARESSRIQVDDGDTPLARRLSLPARAWAAALLAPLRDLPPADRRELTDTARLALVFGPSRAERLLGREQEEAARMALMPGETQLTLSGSRHRNTISRKLGDVMDRVGLDRTRLAHRAVLDLALQLDALPAPPPGTGIPSLHQVLAEAAARDWAAQLLAPMKDLEPRHLRMLATWAECNAHLGAVADQVGRHRNTITRALAEVSAALSRQVTEPGHGQHDAYLALAITSAGKKDLLANLPKSVITPPGDGRPATGARAHASRDPSRAMRASAHMASPLAS
jgi:hypothetical protein